MPSSNQVTIEKTPFGSSQIQLIMSEAVAKGLLIFALLLSLHGCCSSGTLVGFSYDAREVSPNTWLPKQALSFLERNKVPTSQFRVLLSNPGVVLDSLSNTGVHADLCLSQFEADKLLKSKSLALSWMETNVINFLPHLNITSIIVSANKGQLHSLLPALNLIQFALKAFDVYRRIKVSILFSLPTLEAEYETHETSLRRVFEFVKEAESFIIVEGSVDGELGLGDGFVNSAIERAIAACNALPSIDIPIVLNLKSSIALNEVEVAQFTGRVMRSIDRHPQIKTRILGLFADILPVNESDQRWPNWEEELLFSRRELSQAKGAISASRTTLHDVIPSVTNPATTPITVPSTSPIQGIITIPSTDPVTVLPTNPTTTPVTVPSANPAATPITVPSTNPMPTPVTNPATSPVFIPPVMPVTTPAIAPPAVTVNPPATNPATTYLIPPPAGIPMVTPPATTPGTVPVSPGVSGQSWCVAKPGTSEAALQVALDYACGMGGADCSSIQPTGSCYNPSTLQAHASYAFNSYYQKNPVPTSCDFGAAATIVNTNPSTGTCTYPSSSSVTGLNPAPNSGFGYGSTVPTGSGTGLAPTVPTGSGTGLGPTVPTSSGTGLGSAVPAGSGTSSTPTVFNANNSGGSSTVFGSDNSTSTMSNSFSVSSGRTFLVLAFTTIFITGKIW